MPPRYVYWTIIVDGQPTAFRSGSLEDIMPTFNRLKEKQPTAELKWWQNGQLWPSRHDAQDFMRARGERGRAKDPRQSGGDDAGGEKRWDAKPAWKTRSSFSSRSDKPRVKRDEPSGEPPAWAPKGSSSPDGKPSFAKPTEGKPEWKPKGSFKPKEAGHRSASDDKPEWKPASAKATEAKPYGQARSDRKPEWKPKGTFKPKEAGHSSGWGEKPGWKAKEDRGPGSGTRDSRTGGKPAWVPKGKSTFRPEPGSRIPDPGSKPAWKGKPSGSARDQARSSFRPKSYTPKDPSDAPTRSAKARDQKLDWKPASAKASARQAPDSRPAGPNAGFAKSESDGPKRKWVPKAEYKKSLGIEAKKDDKWRPGGDHVDPKQKYKDAKKAKWGRFKEAIRSRSSKPKR